MENSIRDMLLILLLLSPMIIYGVYIIIESIHYQYLLHKKEKSNLDRYILCSKIVLYFHNFEDYKKTLEKYLKDLDYYEKIKILTQLKESIDNSTITSNIVKIITSSSFISAILTNILSGTITSHIFLIIGVIYIYIFIYIAINYVLTPSKFVKKTVINDLINDYNIKVKNYR